MSKIWQSVNFWLKIKATIASIGVGGEITMIATEQSAAWHYATIVATIIGILITNFVEDKDNDGIVDLFEDKTIKPKDE